MKDVNFFILTDKGSEQFLPPVYGLDSTDVSLWEEHVYKPAVDILTAMLKVIVSWCSITKVIVNWGSITQVTVDYGSITKVNVN